MASAANTLPHSIVSNFSRVRQRRRERRAPRHALISVIIVNFRQWENTVALTHQLDRADCMRSGQSEVILIDNDPSGHPLRRCVRYWPGVSLRCFDRNRGFARAVNEGCRRSRGEWLLLLNPDVRVPDEFLDKAIAAAEEVSRDDPQTGIIGFQLRHADGSRQGSTGHFPTLASVLSGLLRPRSRRRCQPVSGLRRRKVDWVTGCCLMVRKSCWEELGGFDEDYFLYYEDADLCQRARQHGWSVWYEPKLRVTHLTPLHSRSVPAPLRLMTRHALLMYASKHWPKWQQKLLACVVGCESAVRWLSAKARGQRFDAAHFQDLGRMSLEIVQGQFLRARQRVLRAADALASQRTHL